MASSVPGPCGHILYPLCRCNPTTGDVLQAATTKPALTPKGVDIVAGAAGIPPVAPAAPSPAPSESTHAGPAPKKRRTAAPPWSPNYQDPVTGEYPNRRPRRKSEEEQLAELEAAIFAALESPDSGAAQKVLDELAAADARASFAEFFRQAWHVTDPGTELVWNWHLALLCAVVQVLFFDWLKGKKEKNYFPLIRNVVVNIPPGTSKSRCLSVLFPAWAWLHCPEMKFLCLSVNEDAMMRDARIGRDVIRSPWYVKNFDIKWDIKTDQDAASSYGLTSGGERISKASKSEIVGLRADCVAGDTKVWTELGDVDIEELHDRAARGLPLPRVWSMNHETGDLELRRVLATRKSRSSTGVVVRTESNNVLRCTANHRVWNDSTNTYQQAAHLAGSRVSVLRRADVSQSSANTATLPELSVRHAELRDVLEGVLSTGRGVRQASATRADRGTVLQQALQDDRESAACGDADLHCLPSNIQDQREDASDLLASLRGRTAALSHEADHQELPEVWRAVSLEDQPADVLQQGVRGCAALGAHDGRLELELLGTPGLNLRGRALDEPRATDSRARRVLLRDLRYDGELSGDAGASYRREHVEQLAGEPHHALRQLSHHASQVEGAAVLSVDEEPECAGGATYDVYDIQVERNHNFFASGVLVHNCLIIDDPNNPKKSENEKERAEVNSLWSTNQWNRVNDLAKSLRIGVQQRTHEEDWTGAVLEAQGVWSPSCGDPSCDAEKKKRDGCCNTGGWLHVVLPADYEESRKFVMPKCMQAALRAMDLAPEDIVVEDPRTEEGESLDPIRLSRQVLADLRKHWRGTNSYAGQMQQRPASSEGNKISSKWWGWCKLAGGVREDLDALGISGPTSAEGRPRPAGTHSGEAKVIHQRHYSPGEWDFDWITISIDCASKKTEKGSNYGILVVAGKGGQRFVLDDATQRGALHEIIEVLVGSDANPERPRDKGLVQRWRPTSILIEDKAAGDNVMDTLREQMAAGDVPMVVIETCDPGNADKEMRLEAATPYIKNGQVFLLDGADWLEEFVEEFRLYPAGKRDDRVDALSQILNYKRAAADEWPDY